VTRYEIGRSSFPVSRFARIIHAGAFCALPILVGAQDVAGLTGVVTDSSGAVVPEVAVKLVNTATNATYETKTNSAGSYLIGSAVPGPGYQVTFNKQGFNAVTVSDLYLGVNTTHTQNIELAVGTTSTTVDVNAEGTVVSLNTSDATVATALTRTCCMSCR